MSAFLFFKFPSLNKKKPYIVSSFLVDPKYYYLTYPLPRSAHHLHFHHDHSAVLHPAAPRSFQEFLLGPNWTQNIKSLCLIANQHPSSNQFPSPSLISRPLHALSSPNHHSNMLNISRCIYFCNKAHKTMKVPPSTLFKRLKTQVQRGMLMSNVYCVVWIDAVLLYSCVTHQ